MSVHAAALATLLFFGPPAMPSFPPGGIVPLQLSGVVGCRSPEDANRLAVTAADNPALEGQEIVSAAQALGIACYLYQDTPAYNYGPIPGPLGLFSYEDHEYAVFRFVVDDPSQESIYVTYFEP